MHNHPAPVELSKAYRLINHGPTTLVSAYHLGIDNVMAVAWVCGLDFDPPKLTAVIAGTTATRRLIEGSGHFVVQIPTAAQLKLTQAVGNLSLDDMPDKLQRCGVELFRIDGHPEPFVAGCAAWLRCRVIAEPHNQKNYDLFIGEITGAWADHRVFRNGRWQFEHAGPGWRSLHHVAGGRYYATGEALTADGSP